MIVIQFRNGFYKKDVVYLVSDRLLLRTEMFMRLRSGKGEL